MGIEEKIDKLIPLIEEYASEIGVDKIYAGSYTDLVMDEHFLYPVFIFHNGLKQQTLFNGNFIKDNDFEVVLDKIKQRIKQDAEMLKQQ